MRISPSQLSSPRRVINVSSIVCLPMGTYQCSLRPPLSRLPHLPSLSSPFPATLSHHCPLLTCLQHPVFTSASVYLPPTPTRTSVSDQLDKVSTLIHLSSSFPNYGFLYSRRFSIQGAPIIESYYSTTRLPAVSHNPTSRSSRCAPTSRSSGKPCLWNKTSRLNLPTWHHLHSSLTFSSVSTHQDKDPQCQHLLDDLKGVEKGVQCLENAKRMHIGKHRNGPPQRVIKSCSCVDLFTFSFCTHR